VCHPAADGIGPSFAPGGEDMEGVPSREGSHAIGAAVGSRAVRAATGGGLHRMGLLPDGAMPEGAAAGMVEGA